MEQRKLKGLLGIFGAQPTGWPTRHAIWPLLKPKRAPEGKHISATRQAPG
jgi:hypothetical protein